MNLSFKYRLYPNKEQGTIIEANLRFCSFLYNCALEERISHYRRYGKGISYHQQSAHLPEIKREFREQTQTLYSQTLQEVLKRLDQGFANFFRRVKEKASKAGFPRYRSVDRFRSLLFPQITADLRGRGGIKLLDNGKLKVFGLPGELKIKLHRPWKGRCKQAIIKKQGDKFYLILSCDEVPLEPIASTNKTIAIDLGLNAFITADDGTKILHPKPYKTAKEKIARLNRELALKKRGSNNRERVKLAIARAYEKVSNVRGDFLHKTASTFVGHNDVIFIEDLDVEDMLERTNEKQPHTQQGEKSSHKVVVNKGNIQDASWGNFATMLSYKAERAGKMLIEVDPKNTSKMCSGCSNIKSDLTLTDRVYNCEACSLSIDRDLNAALNIKQRGEEVLAEKLRLGVSLATAKEKTVSEANDIMSSSNSRQTRWLS